MDRTIRSIAILGFTTTLSTIFTFAFVCGLSALLFSTHVDRAIGTEVTNRLYLLLVALAGITGAFILAPAVPARRSRRIAFVVGWGLGWVLVVNELFTLAMKDFGKHWNQWPT